MGRDDASGDPGGVRAAYVVVKLRNGEVKREVMPDQPLRRLPLHDRRQRRDLERQAPRKDARRWRCRSGTLDAVAEKDRFAVALKAAQAWFDEQDRVTQGQTVIPSKMTLRQVIQAYIIEQGKKPKNGQTAASSRRSRFNLLVVPYADENGGRWIDTPVARITTAEFAAWRDWVAKSPRDSHRGLKGSRARARRSTATWRTSRPRSTLRPKCTGSMTTGARCQKRDKAEDEEGRGSAVYLDSEQRARLLASAQEVAPALYPFAKAQMIVPVHPGALAALTVAAYNRAKHFLWIEDDKGSTASAGCRCRSRTRTARRTTRSRRPPPRRSSRRN